MMELVEKSVKLDYMQGLLDPQYGEVQALQDESTPHCMSTVINVYCANAERMINQMSGIL